MTFASTGRAIAVASAIASSFIFSQNSHANVLGLFQAGAGCKSAAMESAGDCTEAQTLMYNPAVLSNVSDGLSGELGVARLDYGYENPSYDPVRVRVVSPMFSQGWKSSFAENRGSWGFSLMPAGSSDLTIKGLPRRVSGTVMSLNVRSKRQQIHIPVGASYAFSDSGVTVGASLIYTYDKRSINAAAVSDPNASIIDMTSKGHFFRPVIGSTWHNDSHSAAASYMFPLEKHFSGRTKIGGDAPYATEQVDYDPAMLLLSTRMSMSGAALSANFNHIYGENGRHIQRDGINRTTKIADLKDANHVGARASYKTLELGEISVAAAYLDSYWGEGYYYKDADGIPHHEVGHLFGQFNAIPVRTQALTWRCKVAEWDTHAAVTRTSGATTVSANGDNPGYYQIEFVSVTLGVQKSI
jgi:hypothetical protein